MGLVKNKGYSNIIVLVAIRLFYFTVRVLSPVSVGPSWCCNALALAGSIPLLLLMGHDDHMAVISSLACIVDYLLNSHLFS